MRTFGVTVLPLAQGVFVKQGHVTGYSSVEVGRYIQWTRGPGTGDPGTRTRIGIHCIYSTCVSNRSTGMHYGTD